MRKAMSFHNRFWALADLGDESLDEGDGDAPFESEHDEHHLDEAYGFMGFAWHKLSPFWSMRKIQNSM